MDKRQETVDAYRKAAAKLFKANKVEQEIYIRHPDDDTGGWAPDAKVIIYLEPDMRRDGDEARIPSALNYWDERGRGIENCAKLGDEVGDGSYVEYINAAVAAVW